MIAKNEEMFLDSSLKSVKAVLGVEDMVVVDTGSTDSTKEIALNNGARVFDFEWCDDFSAARNFAAENAANDWIFALDADEEVTGADLDELDRFLKSVQTVGSATEIEMTNQEIHSASRLYNRKYYRYEGSIHEQLTPFVTPLKVIENVPISIVHYGYLPEFKKAKGKLERNETMLKKELSANPEDPYLLYQLGKCYFDGNWNLPGACENFEKSLKKSPDVKLEYVYSMVECYGYALINTEQYKKALKLMNDYAKYYKNKPEFRFLSAHIYQNNGMLIEAVECYESCIGADMVDRRGITSYLSYYNIGVILELVGMKDDAIQMYISCGDYLPAVQRLSNIGKR